jgi:hypothetical protein
VVRLDLYWLPAVDGSGHEAAVRLGSAPEIGNGNGPGCDHSDSWKDWRAGRPFVRRHSIPIDANAAPGRHPLRVGMSSAAQRGLLPVVAGPGAGGTEVEISQIEIVR